MQPGRIVLRTNSPIASDSVDHLFPHGTAKDSTHWPPFVVACEKLFGVGMSVLDLGCAGGGLVYDFASRGHDAYGLEGSDFSMKQGRAEWARIPDRLFTCDLAAPFALLNPDTGQIRKFDIVMAWDVLEHIPKTALSTLFSTVRDHMNKNGIFVGSVSTRAAGIAPDGRNYHATVENKAWWLAQLQASGLYPAYPMPFDFADYPRGNGNNFPANFADNPESGFHFSVRKHDHAVALA